MRSRRYEFSKWTEAKRRILSRPVSMTDSERVCVECQVRSLEDWLKRYRRSQGVK